MTDTLFGNVENSDVNERVRTVSSGDSPDNGEKQILILEIISREISILREH